MRGHVVVELVSIREIRKFYKWIIEESNVPWLRLDLDFPHEAMLEEAKNVNSRFVIHRKMHGRGWKSLCIHGISDEETNAYQMYGYENEKDVNYVWTEASKLCPVTTKYFKESFPLDDYKRLRFMLLKSKGYITVHRDAPEIKRLGPINFALNHPKNCLFKIKDYGMVPYKPGTAFILNVSHEHAVINPSNEDRYHMIVHAGGKDNLKWQQLIINSYLKYNAI